MRYAKIILSCLFAAALLLPSCKESPSVYPFDVFVSAASGNSGYWYPIASIIPANGTLNVPVNSKSVIVFNMPIDPSTISPGVTISSSSAGALTEGPANDYEISMNTENTIATITFHYGGANPLPPGDNVQIDLASTIREPVNNAPLNNPGSWLFTTGIAPDITPPAFVGGSNNPTGAGIELTNVARLANGHEIHIDFGEAIDPDSVDLVTFSLTSPGPSYKAATYTFNGTYTRAILTPVDDLIYNTTYTVTLTTGVKDLSGNNLSAGTSWTFTTTTTPPDPFGVAPVLTGPQVDLVRTNDALISWYYNKPANYTLYYGRGSGVGDMSSSLAGTYSTFQAADLTGLLTTNKRYWFYIDFADVVGNSGTTGSGSPYQLNTESGEGATSINNGPGHQHSANKLAYHPVNGNPTGLFLFWSFNSGGNNLIRCQLYDNNPTAGPLWAAGGVHVFDSNNNTYTASAEDGIGGVIVIAQQGGLHYAKRLDNSGNLLWGYTAASNGHQLSAAAISSVSVVPVYKGITQNITSGTTEMASLGLSNYFFDDDQSLSAVKQGDIIIDPVNHTGTTAVKTGQDFVYVLGQAAGVIIPTRAYYIGDAATNNTIDVHNHQLANTNDAPQTPPPQYNYTSGGTTFNTDHGWTPPSAPAWMGAGDIVLRNNNSTYGRLSSMTQLTPITYIYTGLADGLDNTHLYDWTYQFINTSDNDYVVNDTETAFSTRIDRTWYEVSPGVYWWTLTLNAPGANFSAGDTYHIYDLYCNTHITQINQFNSFYQFVVDWAIGITSGLSATTIYNYTGPTGTAQTMPANPLCDNEASFNGTVLDGDVVVNTTLGDAAVVNSIAPYNYIHALGLNYNIMTDNDAYNIIRYQYTPVVSGRTDGAGPDIQDSVTDFNVASVVAGDFAYNPVTNQYSLITNVAQHVLTLKTDIGLGNGDYYAVFHQGVLYVWQSGTDVVGLIRSMEGSPPANLRGPWVIIPGTNPRAIPDGSGNAIVVYNYPPGGGVIRAMLLDAWGSIIWNPVIDATPASIVDIKSDNAGGVVVLYKYANNDLHIQRIDSSGALLWGAAGLSIVIGATASTQEVMEYIAPSDVIVAANISNNTYIWRRSTTPANNWSRNISVGTAYNPQLYYNSGSGGTVMALWQDTRFHNPPATYINTGYGVFGLKMNYTGGGIVAGWTANGTGAADNNGVSIILNRHSYLLPNPLVVPYNDGANSLLIWEDYRQGRDNDLVFYRLDNFAP